jgi:hypothetical protein
VTTVTIHSGERLALVLHGRDAERLAGVLGDGDGAVAEHGVERAGDAAAAAHRDPRARGRDKNT